MHQSDRGIFIFASNMTNITVTVVFSATTLLMKFPNMNYRYKSSLW